MKNQLLNLIEDKKNQELAVTTLLLTLLYLLQLAVFFGIGGRDDSYITYWSAYSLSELGEIVNYNGDRIEQSSSLLHVLLLALLHKISGLSLPTLGIIFSIICGIVTALLAGKLARESGSVFHKWIPFIVIFVPYFSYWSSSGMEASLAALCIIVVLITSRHLLTNVFSKTDFIYAALGVALYIMVRPESIFVLVAYFLLLLSLVIVKPNNPNKGSHVTRIMVLLALAIAIFLGLTAWRYSYFGQFFPQPVYAKTDIFHISERLYLGLRYLEYSLNFSTSLLVILTAVTIVTLFIKKKNTINASIITHCLFFLIAYLAFVAFTGGDWMEARRLIVPIIPVICVLAFANISKPKAAYVIFPLFFLLATLDTWQLSKKDSIGLAPLQATQYAYLAGQTKPDDNYLIDYGFSPFDSFNYSHLRDMLTIPVMDNLVKSLSNKQERPIYIASRQMGMIPFYIATKHYKKVKFIDLRGLVTKDIPDCHFVSDNKPKSSSGILITSRHYLEYQAQINSTCSLPLADIIYDTGLINNTVEETRSILQANGYNTYYIQKSKTNNLFSQYIGISNAQKSFIP